MDDYHTDQRQAWIKTLHQPTLKQLACDMALVLLGAALIIMYSLLEG